MGLGRITKKIITVTKVLSASASDRRSEQCWEKGAVENLKERGKDSRETDGGESVSGTWKEVCKISDEADGRTASFRVANVTTGV